MECRKSEKLQLFIRSPDHQSPIRALTLKSNQTWADLKNNLPCFNSSSSSELGFFSFNGRRIDESTTVGCSGIAQNSTVDLHFKLLGGGGDGGSTCAESRDCYLKMYAEKKPDKGDPSEKRLSKWTTCALSNEPLKPPCVIDRLGNVFNKEALVKAMLAKTLPKPFSLYIKGLKDLISIQLSSVNEEEDGSSRFQCPISGFEFNGNYRFFALSKCGHILSAKALKEIKSSACIVCHKEFEADDKIVINGTDEEVDILRKKMIQMKEKEKEKKAASKVKKPKSKQLNSVGVTGEDDEGVSVVTGGGVQLSGKKHGIDVVNAKPELNAKLPNAGVAAPKNASVKKFKAVDIAPPNADKKVYASLFTSSRKSDFKETYSCRSLPLGRN